MSTITTVLAMAVSLSADADGWGHMGGWGWGMAVFGWLFMAALVGLIVWLISSVVRRPESNRSSNAFDILDARYARGEIDRDEYFERKADLDR